MDFAVPDDIVEFIERLDDFIEREIKPMEQENDNIRFLDHRREDSRTVGDHPYRMLRGVRLEAKAISLGEREVCRAGKSVAELAVGHAGELAQRSIAGDTGR